MITDKGRWSLNRNSLIILLVSVLNITQQMWNDWHTYVNRAYKENEFKKKQKTKITTKNEQEQIKKKKIIIEKNMQ